ncbi:hypothetical protein CHUAL_003683 [Chamberlinius hualienensis]
MYSNRVSKGLQQTRKGLTQKIENIDSQRELMKKSNTDMLLSPIDMCSPKPVFQVNGKHRTNSHRVPPQEFNNPHHKEIVKYISDDWNKVISDHEKTKNKNLGTQNGPVYYKNNSTSSDSMPDFMPFDLEAWWGLRLFQHLTQNT